MRAKKFKVEVKDYDGVGDFQISITHNGHQWWSTWLNREEWPEIVEAVDKYFEKNIPEG